MCMVNIYNWFKKRWKLYCQTGDAIAFMWIDVLMNFGWKPKLKIIRFDMHFLFLIVI